MKKISVTKNDDLLENAKDLRKSMTRHEKHLWYDYLQNYPIKIYKQRIIDNYIADFYCHKARLVIELDGSQHYSLEGKAYDKARSEALGQHGLLVLRFSNTDIDKRFDGVCRMIDKIIKQRIEETSERPSQSPDGDSSPKGEPMNKRKQ